MASPDQACVHTCAGCRTLRSQCPTSPPPPGMHRPWRQPPPRCSREFASRRRPQLPHRLHAWHSVAPACGCSTVHRTHVTSIPPGHPSPPLPSRLAVDGLAVTRSARGNTAKQVIMLTPAGECAGSRRVGSPSRASGPWTLGAAPTIVPGATIPRPSTPHHPHPTPPPHHTTPHPTPPQLVPTRPIRPCLPAGPPLPGPAPAPHSARRQAHGHPGASHRCRDG